MVEAARHRLLDEVAARLVVWRSIVSADGQFNDVNGRILDLSGQPLGFSTVKVTYSSGYETTVCRVQPHDRRVPGDLFR